MRRVCNHLGYASRVIISNCWLLTDSQGRSFLIDSGHPLERAALAVSLWRAGVRKEGDLSGVILTHRHSDHAGNAAWLRQRFGCPVACHEADAAVLSGTAPAPKMAERGARGVDELLCRIEDRFPSRTPIDVAFSDGPWNWGFHVVHVPGHTSGSVLLLHESTRTLFSGDALLTGPPAQRRLTRLRLAMSAYSQDARACHRATLDFLTTRPGVDWLAGGHGPVVQEPTERLNALLARAEMEP